ncbi:Thymidine kinase 2, mitochondrial [Portunus trituberculatus]|uniref:Thymidine kinase 2, mitochondrial n=1 Tax=Portunus trituberculatus TaxID=210409 RepID=A0A5B7FJR9_PORTR|nr:Thymidine kinase 2, mitochondrial [Portunus trituberculatus]
MEVPVRKENPSSSATVSKFWRAKVISHRFIQTFLHIHVDIIYIILQLQPHKEEAQVHQQLTRIELPRPNFEMLTKGNKARFTALMYEDPKRWAHTFQAYVQMTMVEQHLHPCSTPVKLLERSLYSGRHCFVENLYRSGKMTNAEYTVYCEWFKIITQSLDVGVDLIGK